MVLNNLTILTGLRRMPGGAASRSYFSRLFGGSRSHDPALLFPFVADRLGGAVLDGGTLGFRAVRVRCGEWLVGQTRGSLVPDTLAFKTQANGRPGTKSRQVADHADSAPCPPGWRCIDLDCSLLSLFPAAPAPVDLKFGCDGYADLVPVRFGEDGVGHPSVTDRDGATPLRHPSGVFRPPRHLAS